MLSKVSSRFLLQASKARVVSAALPRSALLVSQQPAFVASSRLNSSLSSAAAADSAAASESVEAGLAGESQLESAPTQTQPKKSGKAFKSQNKRDDKKQGMTPARQLVNQQFSKVDELLTAGNLVEAASLFLKQFDPNRSKTIMFYDGGKGERLVYRLFRAVMLEHRARFGKAYRQFILQKKDAAEKVAKGIASAQEKELAEANGYPYTLDLKDGLVTPHDFYSKLLEANVTISWMCSETILWDIAVGQPSKGLEIWVRFVEAMNNLEKINDPKCKTAAISAMAAYVMTCINENSPIDFNIALQLVPLKELPDDTSVSHLFSSSNATPASAFPKKLVQQIQDKIGEIRFNSFDPASIEFLDSLPSDQPLELERRYQECVKKSAISKTPLPEHVYSRFIGLFAESLKYDRALSVWQDMISSADYTPTIQSWNMLIKAVTLIPKNPVVALEGLINKMQESGVQPNSDTYSILLHAYFKNKNPDAALEIFEKIKSGEIKVPITLHIHNVMLTGLMNAGREEMAVQLLNEGRKKGLAPDIVSFNIFISQYLKKRRYEDVTKILNMMRETGVAPSIETFTNYIDSIFKLANEKNVDPMPSIEELMHTMSAMGLRTNVATFTAIIDGISKGKNGGHGTNLMLYRLMQKKNLRPNKFTFAALINGEILSGDLPTAVYFFNEMPAQNVIQTEQAYNQLFREFATRGMVDESIDLFRKMVLSRSASPNQYTYTFVLRGLINASRWDLVREVVQNLSSKPSNFSLGTALPDILKNVEAQGITVPKFNGNA